MKKYIVTLLKDLPDVKAGFTFKVSEDMLNNHHGYCGIESQVKGMDDDTFAKMLHAVLDYKDYSDWVNICVDISQAIQIQCPNCKNIGMFPYYEKELQQSYQEGVGTYWYQDTGLECPHCNHRLKTHSVCVKKKIN